MRRAEDAVSREGIIILGLVENEDIRRFERFPPEGGSERDV